MCTDSSIDNGNNMKRRKADWQNENNPKTTNKHPSECTIQLWPTLKAATTVPLFVCLFGVVFSSSSFLSSFLPHSLSLFSRCLTFSIAFFFFFFFFFFFSFFLFTSCSFRLGLRRALTRARSTAPIAATLAPTLTLRPVPCWPFPRP